MARILVVDDEPAIRRSVRRVLERAGHEVTESSDGAEALELLRRSPQDILITDLHMPALDGIELTRALKKSPGVQPRIIIMAGSAEGLVRDMAEELGALVTLPKPFRREELLAAVAKVTAS